MNQIYSEVSQLINARPDQINSLISKYRDGYGENVLKHYFMDIRLQDKPEHAGNVVTVKMNLSGALHQFEEQVSEGMPLRIIIEFYAEIDAIIVTTVEATPSSDKTRVTIYTIDAGSPHLPEFIETLFAPKNFAHIFSAETWKLPERILKFADFSQAG